jgi:hypothetical protein
LHKALEDAGIKLDCVAADILGRSGRDMLDALVAGQTDPQVLADLARKQMRKKIPALREALTGHFDVHHRMWIGAILRHIDFLDEQIERLTHMIAQHIRPFAPAVELLSTIPGIQRIEVRGWRRGSRRVGLRPGVGFVRGDRVCCRVTCRRAEPLGCARPPRAPRPTR